ncbi:MAG: redoxin domain-containing protein [Flavobacteriales bacterium]|nr:redoxin domain-containing protein [Flavobacteriales bacterium]
MTRTFIPSIALVSIIACTGAAGQRAVEVSVEGGAGRTVYFDRFDNNRPVHVDSVKLDANGKGSLKIPAMPLDFYRLVMDQDQLVIALDSAESLSIEATLGRLSIPTKVAGSRHSEALQTFSNDARAFDEEHTKLKAAVAQGDTAQLARFNALTTAYYEQCKAFASEHAGSPAALTALGRLNMLQDLQLFKMVRDSLRVSMPRSTYFAMFRDQVDRVDQQQVAMRMQEEEMKRLSNLLPVGGAAPEINQQTPEGGSFALSKLRGKIVLIDFWASWCRPCRIENPNVKKVYAKYASKGFEILGVSLDRDHAAWVKAIKDDGLPWKHVSDLGFWNNAAAQEYGVQSIPYTVLVDREGNIIEKGLRGEQLESRLAELLK